MRRAPRLMRNERKILEAGARDSSRDQSHINGIISELGGIENANDQMSRLVGRGLAEWTLRPTRAIGDRVGLGHVRVTHAGQEALRLDTPLRRTTVWVLDGVPSLLWAITIAVESAAAGAVVTVLLTDKT